MKSNCVPLFLLAVSNSQCEWNHATFNFHLKFPFFCFRYYQKTNKAT